jgi:DUF1680 family protein
MIGHCLQWMERLGWLPNFDKAAAGTLPEGRTGWQFSDSEIYKVLEAMAWEIGRTGDEALEEQLQAITTRVATAQEPDGYIDTMFGRPGQEPRYSDLTWGHELYCMGHLIQAGVARARTVGLDDDLVDVAIRAADHVCREFGPGGREGTCGHPEVETALVELSRVTGDSRYRDQARVFVDRRGHGDHDRPGFEPPYFLDDVPVRDATVLRGHAVRALYFLAGVIDTAVDDVDDELLAAAVTQMTTTLARRTYITGGMGSRHEGEAFGDDWELPSDRAYCETCAGIASVMASQRLLLATGDPRYADAIERSLYNVVATSPSADGRRFFYANPLRQTVLSRQPDNDDVSQRAGTGTRMPWFEVSCCPSNLTRMFASLGAYIATTDDEGVQIHQYADAMIEAQLDAHGEDPSTPAAEARLRVATDYPDAGRITVTVIDGPQHPWTLTLRVPGWADRATLTTPDGEQSVSSGYVEVTRAFTPGETVVLDLDVRARWTWPDPRIDAVRGCVAVERGPLVMALESVDLGVDTGPVCVDVSQPPTDNGRTVTVQVATMANSAVVWPYGSTDHREADAARTAPLIPYHDWSSRGPSTMRVWLPVQ